MSTVVETKTASASLAGKPALAGKYLTAGKIEPTPDFRAKIDTSYLLGMAKVKGQVKTLLDLDRVVAPEVVQAITQAAA